MKLSQRILATIGIITVSIVIYFLLFNLGRPQNYKNNPTKFGTRLTDSDVYKIIDKQSLVDLVLSDKKPKYTAQKELDKLLLKQTVGIVSIGKGFSTCSGTIIYEDDINHYILTAKHCIDVTEEMYVEHIKVIYVITSTDDDLALLVTNGKISNKSVAKFANYGAYIGNTVYHVAYPMGITYKASGQVTFNSDDWQYVNFVAIKGCSGGGIFNDKGELVSLLWGGYLGIKKNAPMKTVTEPLKDIRKFLNTIGLKK